MDHISIKEEIEDNAEGMSVPSETFSIIGSRSSHLPPTQRVLPSPMSSRGEASIGDGNPFGNSFRNQDLKFERETIVDSKPPCMKRKGPELDLSKLKHPRGNQSLMSPPLLPRRPSFHIPKTNNTLHGYQQNGVGCTNGQDGGIGQEDEWRNIKVMLNCISGMVEKTQSAISILQQRQSEVANVRNAEELVAEVQDKAHTAILEVKEAALDEINKAKGEQRSKDQSNCKDESCWNCGRPASETCSGCSLGKYCGPFCQHKDWENHSSVCRPDQAREDISPPDREKRASKN